ncbi:TraB/GumN family protein [Winogradskyella sp. PG-2]|uniref:TraB/GumN family protein n=1 Tax=Winogradskyella sp. PG-2 TaxID=754409 RepID=UPI000458819B|nr:TraB/GumN family protein [Winogradskyella sp. PG-2]BAO75671.1 TonB-dependent receptor domain protein [Winogradskyella sp. PG-2]
MAIRGSVRMDNNAVNTYLYRKNNASDNFEEESYLDMFIFQAGKKNNKKIYGLEDLAESRYLTTKAAYNANKKDLDPWIQKLYAKENPYHIQENLYRDRNLDLLDSIGAGVNTEFCRENMLYIRNENMVISLEKLMPKKSVFAGVGAAHLPGDKGMINMLRQRGYKVKSLTSKQSDYSKAEKLKLDSLFVAPVLKMHYTPDDFMGLNTYDELREFSYAGQKYYLDPDMTNGAYLTVNRISRFLYLPNEKENINLKDIDNLLYEDIPGDIIKKEELRVPYPGISIINKTKKGEFQKYHIYQTPLEIIIMKFAGRSDFVLKHQEKIFNSIVLKEPSELNKLFVSPNKKFQVNFPEYFITSNMQNSGKKLLEGYKNDAYYFLEEAALHDISYIEEDSFEAKYFHHALHKNYKLAEAEGGFKAGDYKTYESKALLDSTSNKNLHLKTIVKDGSYYLLGYVGANEIDKTAFFKSFKFNTTDHKGFEKVVDTSLHFSVTTNTKPPIPNPYSFGGYSDGKEDKDYEEKIKSTTYSSKSNEQIIISRRKFHDLQMYHNIDSLWKETEEKMNYSRYYAGNKKFKVSNRNKSKLDDTYAFSFSYTDSASAKQVLVKNILKKGVLFELKTLIDSISGPSTFVTEFYDSFTPIDTLMGKSVLNDKTAQFFEALRANDSIILESYNLIKFKTKFFTNGTESTIEDLLKKIPGLNIDSEGTIKVGNQEIEKLMVDGDDLFEKGYKILSKNMPAYPIEEVEILKRYSNNRLLKNIEESNKVALNLKLDEKSKRIWFGNIELGFGNDSFYQLKCNLMNFGKKNKYYFLANGNSIGYDATGDIEQLIRPFRFDEPGSIGDNQKVNNLLNLSAGALNFKRNRTNFNNAELASLNAIFNPNDKLKIKTLGFFNWDETNFFRNSTEVTDVNNANFTNTEDYRLRNKKRLAFGKVDLIYNMSKTKMLEVTTKYNNGNFEDGSNLLFNGNSTIESLQYQNILFDQKINYTNKFKNNKAFLLTGRFIHEKTPQNYSINQFFYEDLFQDSNTADNVKQASSNKMQFLGLNAHLLDRKENGNLLELKLGNEYRYNQIDTRFSLLEDNVLIDEPNGFQNKLLYSSNDLYFKSKYRFKFGNIGLAAKANFHQLFNRLENFNSSQSQNPFFINPSITLDWKINDKNKIITNYSYNTTNANALDVYDNFVLTGFRSFSTGTGDFNQLDASSLNVNYQLGNWSDRFFANTFLLYSKNHDFFTTNTVINQNFTQASKILIQDREFITINLKLDYYLKFMASNLKLDIGYTNNEFKNIVNNSGLRTVNSQNFNYGLELRSGFKGIFNYHIGTKWLNSKIETIINNSFTNNTSFLDLSIVFNDKFDAQIQTERYYFGNLQIENTYYFLDFDMRYKLKKDKLTVGLSGKNLLNTKTFRSFSISDIGSSTTEYRLLPRFVLLKLEYRF